MKTGGDRAVPPRPPVFNSVRPPPWRIDDGESGGGGTPHPALSVFVIVLHYRGRDDTRQCLASLGRQTHAPMHTLVIDNGGVDKLGADFGAEFPWAELLELPQNLGWSGGNNAGIRLALERGLDLVCLLNNDTVLPEDAIARLAETAAALGPCVLHPAIDYYDDGEGAQLDPSVPQPADLIVLGAPQLAGGMRG